MKADHRGRPTRPAPAHPDGHRTRRPRLRTCDGVGVLRPPRPSRVPAGLLRRTLGSLMPPPDCDRRAAWRHA